MRKNGVVEKMVIGQIDSKEFVASKLSMLNIIYRHKLDCRQRIQNPTCL